MITNRIWHPFTQMKTAGTPLEISSAKGAYLYTEQSIAVFDAISSWWVILHGHCSKQIINAVKNQIDILDHTLLAGVTHGPAEALAEKMLLLTQHFGMNKVFFSDNGSTAVEVALKISLQYWGLMENPKRRRIISFKNAYHGDTFGAMSLGGESAFNRFFPKTALEVHQITPPTFGREKESLNELRNYLQEFGAEIAAFIFEPMVQGAAGMILQSAPALEDLLKMAKEFGILLIADEVMTGFGRTGKLWAMNHVETPPDLMCVAKGITGGVLPLALTLCGEEIYRPFHCNDAGAAFYHGHSYSGNPIAAAAANANLDWGQKEKFWQNEISQIEKEHANILPEFSKHANIKSCGYLGTILRLEIKNQEKSGYFNSIGDHIKTFFRNENMLIRPLGNIIYLIPPYCTTPEDLKKCYQSIENCLHNI